MLTEQIRLALGAGYTGLLNCKLTAAIVIEHVCVSYSLIGSEMCAIFLIRKTYINDMDGFSTSAQNKQKHE